MVKLGFILIYEILFLIINPFNLDIEYIQIVSEEDLNNIENEITNDEGDEQQQGNVPKQPIKKEKKSKKPKKESNKENNKTTTSKTNSTLLNGSNSNTSLSVYDDIDLDYQDESLVNLTLNKASTKLKLNQKGQKRKSISASDSLNKTGNISILQPPTKRKRLT